MKNIISKNRMIVALTCLLLICLTAILCLTFVPVVNAEETSATPSSTFAYKATTTSTVKYEPLERENLANSATVPDSYDVKSTTAPGIMGNTAIHKNSQENDRKYYQMFFWNKFESGSTYEISFWAKSAGAGSSFYVQVWYQSADKNDVLNTDLPTLSKIEGVWTKYSFTFVADEYLSECLKLTLEFKNTFSDIYLDQFGAYLVDDGYSPIICGEQFSTDDWSTPIQSDSIVSFSGENYPSAVEITDNLNSKYFVAPQEGVYRLRFALQRTSGASASLSIKNILGDTLSYIELTNDATYSYYDVVTSSLQGNDYVYLQFDVTCQSEEDYVTIGAVEMLLHKHDLVEQSTDGCVTTSNCSSCDFNFVTKYHDLEITTSPTCIAAGLRECKNCDFSETLPATGIHTSYYYQGTTTPVDITCSQDHSGVMVICATCGAGAYLPTSHNMVCQSLSDGVHQEVCTNCGYTQFAQDHEMAEAGIAITPTEITNGYAVITYGCQQKLGIHLQSLADVDAWTLNVAKEATCTEAGVWQYLYAQEEIVVECEIEALGHDYQAIKQTPTCTEDGISLHHECATCGNVKEASTEIKVLSAYGHDLDDWIVEKEPTLESEGLRKVYCTRCDVLVEQQVIPKLDEINYTKYALDDHDETKGFYYYYTSNEWGTYSVFVEGKNQDDVTVVAICVACVVVIGGSITAYCIIATKAKKKKVK